MPFTYHCTVHFQDTDAAGVVYFANLLKFCHQAYEASLCTVGVNLQEFFGRGQIAVPITQATVDFLRPLYCGDRLTIHLSPKLLDASSFQIGYQIFTAAEPQKVVSQAATTHVCINVDCRSRLDLPPILTQWLQRWQSEAGA